MGLAAGRVSIGTGETVIFANGKSNVSILVRNKAGGAAIFVGAAGLTTSAGSVQLDNGESISIDLAPGETLYGIVASGSIEAQYLVNRQ